MALAAHESTWADDYRVTHTETGSWHFLDLPLAGTGDITALCEQGCVSHAIADEIEEFLTGVRPIAERDRVLATVLFTDIVGSTEMATAMGDRRWHELLERHHAFVRREVARFRGREIKTTGDGFLLTFDGPARAIRCALALVDGAQQSEMRLRVGVHTGECEIIGDDVGGIAVHIASRVLAQAEPNEVLVTSTLRDLVAGSGLRFASRGRRTLKGVTGEWELLAVETPPRL